MSTLTVLLSIGLFAAPKSDPYVWKNAEIVGGGFISGISFHPREKDLIYARTDIGGAYRWNAVTRRWIPLQDWLKRDDWNLYGVESIGLDPSDPKKLYLAVGTYTNSWGGNGAILRSTDQGRTFQRTDLPFKNGGNENGRSIGERLCIDPLHPNSILFGTRHNGLWKSSDFGATWKQLDSFPIKARTNGIGVGFELFDPKHHAIYAGVAHPSVNLYRSLDDGKTWKAVPGQPSRMVPHHAVLDRQNHMYITYGDGPGPNGVTKGQVFKLDVETEQWTDITPKPAADDDAHGFAGLSIDAQNDNTVMVSSLDRWHYHDDLYRTTDGGATWKTFGDKSQRDSTSSRFLDWGRPAPELGHWIGALQIDPFNRDRVLYGTGATMWGSRDATAIDRGQTTHWKVFAEGLEETAVICLASPSIGAHVLSGLGDIGGFAHFDLTKSPKEGMFDNPRMSNTDAIDFAESKPEIVIRVGRGKAHEQGGISHDGGKTWRVFPTEPPGARGSGSVAISADGSTIVWAANGSFPHYSVDEGMSWTKCFNAPTRGQVVSDRRNGNIYILSDANQLFVSHDGGKTFEDKYVNVPEKHGEMRASFGGAGDVWVPVPNGLWRSRDGAQTFIPVSGIAKCEAVGFGRAAPGRTYPAVFMTGVIDAIQGIYRSDDDGKSWVRINDSAHQFATQGVIAGDPKRFGRVYIGTNGRGVIFGDPVRR